MVNLVKKSALAMIYSVKHGVSRIMWECESNGQCLLTMLYLNHSSSILVMGSEMKSDDLVKWRGECL